MHTLSYAGMTWSVDHAVKGADYVHGYAADGSMVIAIEHTTDLDNITYDGEYMDPSVCADEPCNDVKYVDGKFYKRDGTEINVAALETLWVNSSPSSSFPAQTISLDLTPYTCVFIRFKGIASGEGYYTEGPVHVGKFSLMQCHTLDNTVRQRLVTVNTTGVTFGQGEQGGSSSGKSANYVVPAEIHGLRG